MSFLQANELSIRDEITAAMNEDFNDAADRVVAALGEGYSKTFNIAAFETQSPEEVLRKHDEFGTVYIGQSDFGRVGVLGEKHFKNDIVIDVIAWFLKKGDDVDQVSIARLSLVEVMRRRNFNFESYGNWEMMSVDVLDFSPEVTENIYTGAGVVIKIKLGF